MSSVEVSYLISTLLLVLNAIQFVVNRRDKRKTSAKEKKYQVYSDFMRKIDNQSQKLRNDEGNLISDVVEFSIKYTMAAEPEAKEALLKDFSVKFKQFFQDASDMISILVGESNNLFLLCSEQLYERLQAYASLATEFKSLFDLQFKTISNLKSVEQLLSIQDELQKHGAIVQRMSELIVEIKSLMRKEIGYYKES